jgi:hypothetical protein
MSVKEVFQKTLPRFRPNDANSPATTFVFGIVVPQQPAFSVTISRDNAYLTDNIKLAEYILYGDAVVFEPLLNPSVKHRGELIKQIELRPNYPFDTYLISILLKAFDLDVADLDYKPKRFEGPYPFPPRYPVAENSFRRTNYHTSSLPGYSKMALPELIADDHPTWVKMYNRAWQIAFKNLRQPETESGFVANFIDTAFNANTFMWDSCFMMIFGRYARRSFDFMGTLDNFYSKQHDDGFICREINTYSGKDLFQTLDPRSTGPNILAWTEWECYQHSQDINRLQKVFPVLISYHRWWKEWRRHPDGSYWTSGWGSGMDNQTRVPNSEYHHRGYTWIDAMMQQALSCQTLLQIANKIGRDEFNEELTSEFEQIIGYINTQMWDDNTGFYYDRSPDGCLSQTKSIGAYWGLLSDVIPPDRAERLIAHLQNEKSFNRPHPIPTQAYDSKDYNSYGGYWLGGVWSPTNYMVLAGLSRRGYHSLAHQIAIKHVDQVASIYRETGTLYENYSPEYPQHGIPARREFVGWTGISAITIPIEYLVGIHVNSDQSITWNISLAERHGVLRYPIGTSNTVDLICEDHVTNIFIKTEQPTVIHIDTISWKETFALVPGEHNIMRNVEL